MNEENKPLDKSDLSEIEKALSNIKTAWIAGIIISGLCIVGVIVCFFIKIDAIPILFMAVWVFGLSYGIYKKSRICAIIILVSWILGTLTFAIHGEFIPALIGAILCYPYYKGLMGTLAYYKLDTITKMFAKSQKS
jgi:hypothetical protein